VTHGWAGRGSAEPVPGPVPGSGPGPGEAVSGLPRRWSGPPLLGSSTAAPGGPRPGTSWENPPWCGSHCRLEEARTGGGKQKNKLSTPVTSNQRCVCVCVCVCVEGVAWDQNKKMHDDDERGGMRFSNGIYKKEIREG